MELKTVSSQKNQAFQWKDETKGIKSRLRLIFKLRLEPIGKRENNVSSNQSTIIELPIKVQINQMG